MTMQTTNGNQQKPLTLKELLEKARPSLAAVMPKHLTPDRLIKIALVCVARDKSGKLANCTPDSVLRSVMQAAELGLEIGGSLGDAYLVPYARSWKDEKGQWHKALEAQCIVGYRGMINLARRSGEISSISAHVVHKHDKFKLTYGIEEKLEHEPKLDGDAGDAVAVYAVARFKDGGHQVEVMTIADVNRIRDRPRPGRKEAQEVMGPWLDDYEEMARKTVVRRLAKYLPLSPELRSQLEREDDVELPTIDVMPEMPALVADAPPSKKLAAKIRDKGAAPTPEPEPAKTDDGASYDAATGEVLEEPHQREPGEEG